MVNGQEYCVEIEEHWTILEVLRDCLGLTGTKQSCNMGECGACTVIVDKGPVLSCIMLAADAEGRRITTIEGLSGEGNLHPVQKAFVDEGAIQCGFCTPGMVMTAKALLEENLDPTEEEVRQALSGNVCRCTGYHKPVKAVLAAAEVLKTAGAGGNSIA